MRILNVIAEGRFGGPHRRIIEVAKGLKKKGIETVVVLPNYDSDRFQKLLTEADIPFRAIRIHRITKDWKHLLKFFLFFIPELFHIKRLIKEFDADVVHANGAWQIKSVIAAKLAGTNSVWHLNDTYMPGYILWLMKLVAYFFSDQFIGSSIRTREFYGPHLAEDKRDMQIVLPPVDVSTFDPAITETAPDLEKFDGIRVVTVANVNPIKGYDMFVEMIAEVNKLTDKPCHFYSAGKILANQKKLTDHVMNKVKALNINNVTFFGARSDVKNLLKSADIFVCCSLSESGPMTVFEAMSMEKAIVSTDVGDVRGLFNQDKGGLIVPVNDAVAMAKAIVQLIEDADLRKSMGKNARIQAIEHVDTSCCVNAHETAYRSAVEQSTSTVSKQTAKEGGQT